MAAAPRRKWNPWPPAGGGEHRVRTNRHGCEVRTYRYGHMVRTDRHSKWPEQTDKKPEQIDMAYSQNRHWIMVKTEILAIMVRTDRHGNTVRMDKTRTHGQNSQTRSGHVPITLVTGMTNM